MESPRELHVYVCFLLGIAKRRLAAAGPIAAARLFRRECPLSTQSQSLSPNAQPQTTQCGRSGLSHQVGHATST